MKAEYQTLCLRDGTDLHLKVKEVGSPIWIVATHGIGEHLERHSYLTKLFGSDFNICQYDLRGHGKSGGEGAYVDSFEHFYEDLEEVILYLQKKYKMSRYILFGHSMGALITSGFLQERLSNVTTPELVYLNAPPIGMPGLMGDVLDLAPKSLFRQLVKLPLSLKLGGLVDLSFLSHNIQVKEDYIHDELNHVKLHSKLLLELVKASKYVYSRPLRVDFKAYCSYGTEDKVVGVEAIENYFKHTEKGFKVKCFEGAYHEIHNEIDKYKRPYFKFLKEVFHSCLYPDS